jgi:hypothetical protein
VDAEAETAAYFDSEEDETLDEPAPFGRHVQVHEDAGMMLPDHGFAFAFVPPSPQSDMRS